MQMETLSTATERRYGRWALALIDGLLLFRLVILLLNPAGLHGDEAQYWAWAQEPAFGYYSKPPLIAWIIWTTTAVFGDAEWAVRLASPFLHSLTAGLTFLTARRLYGQKAGFYATALYVLMPGVALSASLISTDAALLVFVALFIHAWVRLREAPQWRWALTLGAAFGLGMMTKYAMIYVVPAFVLAIFFDRPTRQAVLSLRGAVAAGLAGLILWPNLIWNSQHEFATLVHTGDNANLSGGVQLNPDELAEFLLGQLGVFGPLTFILLLLALWAVRRSASDTPRQTFTLWLALLTLTPLLIICIQALISRANANWAGAAYASAPILLAAWALRSDRALRWLRGGVGINAFLCIVPAVIMVSPALVDQLGFANSVKRQRAWPETVDAIRAKYAQGDYEAVAVDNRLVFYDLLYYGLPESAPLYMWRYEPRLNSHAELTRALPQDDRSVLIISYYDTYADYFARDFETLIPQGEIKIDLGGGKIRRLYVYAASGYRGPVYRN
jgi:4-amino-4-deoxy-L-arabinose transferase-like glycosyltransferase